MAIFRKISWKTGGDFLIRIAKLLEQGLPLETAISFLSITLPKERARFQYIIAELRAGKEFAVSLKNASFPDFICAQIFYSNRHGYFITTLRETGEHMLRKADELKKLRKTFQYPVILCVTLSTVFILLRLFLLPKFNLLFNQLQKQDTATTSLLYFLLEKLPLLIGVIMFISALLITFLFFQQKRKSYLDKITLLSHIPILKRFIQAPHSQIFAREIGYLSKCGLSLHDILAVFTETHSPLFLQQLSQSLKKALDSGVPIHIVCSQFLFFEKELIYIIQHGETNGKLAEELLFYYKHSQENSTRRLERLFTYIQPSIFLLIGTFIVLTYLAILFPMFSLVDQL